MIELIGNKIVQEGQVIFEMNLKKRILATGYGRAIIKVDRGFSQ